MPTLTDVIPLRGVRVHNLQGIDLDLPLGSLIAITGVSGAGKSSLAFDTLYAEGQRRYVESFSTYSRHFLERMAQPDAQSIGRIPPAVAVRQSGETGSRRATLGTTTEILDHLRLLFARLGQLICPTCDDPVSTWNPGRVAAAVSRLPEGRKAQIGFPIASRPLGDGIDRTIDLGVRLSQLKGAGFTRAILGDQGRALAAISPEDFDNNQPAVVVVDRLKTPVSTPERLLDSLETAFMHGGGCTLLVEGGPEDEEALRRLHLPTRHWNIDGLNWQVATLFDRLLCGRCQVEFPPLDPALLNFQSPLGACPACHGTGTVVAPLAAAADTKSRNLSRRIRASRNKLQVCPECRGTRLQPQALAIRVEGRTISDVTSMNVQAAREFLIAAGAAWSAERLEVAERLIPAVIRRLELLEQLGLAYLTLDRPLRSLSRGEAQRAKIAAVCGSNLVNLLYVLDEPTAGLHPRDTERLVDVLFHLRDLGNTVVVVEHEPAVIRQVDHVIELGPQAGPKGGQIVFQGSPAGLATCAESATGRYLNENGRSGLAPRERRTPTGWLHLVNIHHRNLRGISVDFPLGALCVVTGVSGSGKSSLVIETLVPAVSAAIERRTPPRPSGKSETRPEVPSTSDGLPQIERLTGDENLDEVLLIDASPIGRSPRSQPASFLGIFNEIRELFAGTAEAKVRNFSPGHFSFNSVGGGRCEKCAGTGVVTVDMRFLPDVHIKCPDCHGSRYRREILDVKYRGLTIAEVLALTAQNAFLYFRGRTRIQRRLKHLKDVGLEYLQLGQPARTLSGGESQRLKLAALLARRVHSRALIVLEEPTTGLHPHDVKRLFDCWNQLLAAGHSLVVIEHNQEVIRAADHIIDLGPESGDAGGRVIAVGPPEMIAQAPSSQTGRFLEGR